MGAGYHVTEVSRMCQVKEVMSRRCAVQEEYELYKKENMWKDDEIQRVREQVCVCVYTRCFKV